MLTGKEVFVVIKLTTGEQIMSALNAEDDIFVELLHPMTIRTIPNVQAGREHITCAPFCVFSNDNTYVLDKKNVMFIKPLNDIFISHYMRVVEDHQKGIEFQPKSSSELGMEDMEHLKGIADVMSAIEQLRPIADDSDSEKERVFVEGNDTKH